MFGFTEAQISGFFLSYGLTGLMLYMVFIVGQLAWQSKAGWVGTFWLFLALCLGLSGFAIKFVIKHFIGLE